MSRWEEAKKKALQEREGNRAVSSGSTGTGESGKSRWELAKEKALQERGSQGNTVTAKKKKASDGQPQPSERLLSLKAMRDAQWKSIEPEYHALDRAVKTETALGRNANILGEKQTLWEESEQDVRQVRPLRLPQQTQIEQKAAAQKTAEAAEQFRPHLQEYQEYEDMYQKELGAYLEQSEAWYATDEGKQQKRYDGYERKYQDGLRGVDLVKLGESTAGYKGTAEADEKSYTSLKEKIRAGHSFIREIQSKSEAQILADIEQSVKNGEYNTARPESLPEHIHWPPQSKAEYLEMWQWDIAQAERDLQELKTQTDQSGEAYRFANEEYQYYIGRIYHDAANDANADAVVEQGKKLHQKAWADYGTYLNDMDGYNAAVALSPEGDVSALAPFWNEARSRYPLAIMVDSLTEENQRIFYYLVGKGQTPLAIQFANEAASESRKQTLQDIRDWAGSNIGTQLLASVGSFALLPSAWSDPVLAQHASDLTGLKNTGGVFGSIKDNLRAGVSEAWNDAVGTLPESVPVLGGKGLGDLYQLGMSMGDSYLSGAVFGSDFASVVLGSNAMSSAFNDAMDKGADTETALMQGFAQGAAEMLFERISLGAFFDGNISGGAIKQALAQGGIEASEELCTSIANHFTDKAIMGDLSEYELAKKAYMENGKNLHEAEQLAKKDFYEGLVFDALGGFLSGGAMGGGAAAIESHQKKKVQSMMEQSTAVNDDPATHTAEEMRTIEEYKNSTDLSLRDCFSSIADEKSTGFFRQKISPVSDRQAQDAARLLGGDYSGYTNNINSNGVRHIVNEHGPNGSVDQSLGDLDDAARLGYVLDNYDSVEVVTYESGDIDTSAEFRNANNEPAPMLRYSKKVNGTYYVVEAIPESRYKKFWVVSAYMEKADGFTQARNAQGPTNTPQASLASQPSANGSIAQPEQSVKGESGDDLVSASEKYGRQAKAMVATYNQGQDVAKFDRAFGLVYEMGKSGVNFSYVSKNGGSYLTEEQKQLAYEIGKAAAADGANAVAIENNAAANGKTGRKQGGVVRGEGMKIADLKKAFNDPRGKVYRALSTISKLTGVNIVLFKSQTDAEGNFIGEQGKYDRAKPGEIWIDIHAGLENIADVGDLEKYVLLRTFSHEFTHFIEKWNPVRYNEFRRIVFDTLTERGVDVDSLIGRKMDETGLSYEAASREAVADAMTDILPDSEFVEKLAQKHKTIFEKILEKLKEFVQTIKDYFESLGPNDAMEANALKEHGKYLDSIVRLWDEIAVEAVETYQQTVATDEVVVAKNETTTGEITTKGNEAVSNQQTGAQKNTADEGGVQYAKRAKKATQKANADSEDTIKKQIIVAAEKLNAMEPVVSIYDPFDTGHGIDAAVKWLLPKLTTTKIDIKGYGTVLFDEHWIRNGLKYVARNSNEVAAMLAVTQVLKKGVKIAHDPNHKGRGFSTTTFGAPVELNGKRGNMGVVVKETSPYHYDVHRILTPEGYTFEIPEYRNAEPTTEEAQSQNETAVVTPISSASVSSITDVAGKSNTQNAEDSGKQRVAHSATDTDGTQNQRRTNTLTNREVLALAAEELRKGDLTAAERDALDIFLRRLAKLEELQEKRAEQGRLYREQQFGANVDRAAAEKTRNRMQILDDQIERAKAEVLSIEDKQILKQVLQKARRVVVKQQLSKAVNQYGAIPAGMNAAEDRTVQIPKRIDGESKVSYVARSAAEANMTPKEFVPEIEQAVIDGLLSYDPDTNRAQVDRAEEWIKYNGFDGAKLDWLSDSGKSKVKAKDNIVRGILLYNSLANQANSAEAEADRRKHATDAMRILCKLQSMVTEHAQAVQVMRLMKKQAPEMQYFALEKSVQKLTDELTEELPDGIHINETLSANWMQALRDGDEATIETTAQALYRDIAAQVPRTIWDKWNAWRYLCMLGNVKTIIRNTAGNALFTPVKGVKDHIGAMLEAVAVKSGWIKQEQRTKSAKWLRKTDDGRALLAFAESDFETVRKIAEGSGKYDDNKSISTDLQQAIQDVKREFTMWGVRHWQKATDWVMNNDWFGDGAFLRHHYKSALAHAAAARGITAQQLQQGEVSQQQLDRLRAYAIEQAKKATFRDTNAVSKALRKLHFQVKGPGTLIGRVLIDSKLAFKSTPANVLVRAAEYSPVGLLKAITLDIYAVKKGTITATEYIERLSSGLTGAGIYGLGWLLASMGLIVGGGTDEDDDRIGRQSYALEIGGLSFTLDWLSPAAVPLFMGVETQRVLEEENTGFFAALFEASIASIEPLLEMSMLSGIQEMIDTIAYSGEENAVKQIVYAFFFEPFISYLSQGVPTLSSQMANTLEAEDEFTYVGDIKSQMGRNFVRSLVKVAEKIPFMDWRQEPYVDEYGRTQDKGNFLVRFANAFLNPSYTSELRITEPDKEIERLETATGAEIRPTRRGYNVTVSTYNDEGEKISSEKVRLTGEQYTAYAREYGQQYAAMVGVLMASELYEGLSDEEKVEAIKYIDSLANEYGKVAANVGYDATRGTYKKLFGLTEAGVPIAEAYAAKLYHDELAKDESLKMNQASAKFANWVANKPWTEEQKRAVRETYGKFGIYMVGDTEKYDALAGISGVSSDTALQITERMDALKPESGYTTVRPVQKWEAVASMSGLSEKQKGEVLKQYMETDKQREGLTKCMAVGVTVKQYVQITRAKDSFANGSWSKSELEEYLAECSYSIEQEEVIREVFLPK